MDSCCGYCKKRRGRFSVAVFNGKYRRQFEEHGIRFEFEKRNRESGHLVIGRERVLPTIEALANFDHSVLTMNRSLRQANDFATEYDIQRKILFNWSATPFAKTARVIGDEVPVDTGQNPRRIDILARDRDSNDYIVLEIKRAEAKVVAIDQLIGYTYGLSKRDEYSHSEISGVLVAERKPPEVAESAQSANIATCEIDYPFTFRKITR